jgi:hypothetical protein
MLSVRNTAFALLIAFSIYIYKSKYKLSSVEEDSRNFSFKDTAAITKILLLIKKVINVQSKEQKRVGL